MNSVFKALDLNQGALSNAILQAAGPQIQMLLNAEKASGAFGDIIVTEGCQLKSMFVYHAITPGWNNDQDQAQKVALCTLWLRWFVKDSQSNCGVVLSVI